MTARDFIPIRPARDLMIPLDSYPHLPDTATLSDAILAFVGSQIERKGRFSLPRIVLIIDGENHLVGQVRRRDILRGLLPDFFTQDESHALSHFDMELDEDMNLAELFKDGERQVLSRNADEPVTRIMRPIETTVSADADLMELVVKAARTESHMLPVMDLENVIGVVRTVEILNQIRRMLELPLTDE
ncbi:MAG: CBS domain-containing protein [Xanthomonadales bacterium]|nr:CBS domain-containing protein [Xanthomonadales bacterium]